MNIKIIFILDMYIIIRIIIIFGYNNIHYEIKEGCYIPEISKDMGSAW